MAAVHAVFQDGVLKPSHPVDLPERCEVEFEPRLVHTTAPLGTAQDEIYDILSR